MMNRQPVATALPFYHHSLHLPHASAYAHHSLPPPPLPQQQHYHDPAIVASLGYRPVLHQQQATSHAEQQQQQQQQQRSSQQPLASAFHDPNLRPHQPLPHRARQQARRQLQQQQQATMAFNGMTDEEIAELQKASNEYEPEVTGPLVGQREPSTAITTEYASADPVFQAKTLALPQKFSHYRRIRGDGRCGWRAVAFGYYESLVHLGNANKFLEEEGRLRSLTNIVTSAGNDPLLYEDFADEAYGLLRKIGSALHTGDAETILIEAFNDDTLQNYIITYLKILTSSWMKTRPGDWAQWLLGQTVEKYCDETVMPLGGEIDQVSLTALKDVLLSQAGIALEVLYLDRSEGEEATTHRMDPVSADGYTVGTIRLLYKPGHYDILYKIEDIPPSAATIQTYLQYSTHTNQDVYDIGVADFMTMIPGMSYAPQPSCWSGSSYSSPGFFGSQAPVQRCSQPSVATTPVTPAPQPQIQNVFNIPTTSHSAPLNQISDLCIRPSSHTSLALAPSTCPHPLTGGGAFRRSAWELDSNFLSAHSQQQLQTAQFRNSHYNTAHFLNPQFQPEEWRPDDEYVTTTSKGARHKTNG